MDYPSEERMIRMVLEDVNHPAWYPESLYHQSNFELITESLNYGANVVNIETIDPTTLTSIHKQNKALDIKQASI